MIPTAIDLFATLVFAILLQKAWPGRDDSDHLAKLLGLGALLSLLLWIGIIRSDLRRPVALTLPLAFGLYALRSVRSNHRKAKEMRRLRGTI